MKKLVSGSSHDVFFQLVNFYNSGFLLSIQHFTNRRDEFEATRENILVWLTEMDLQLTNVEHFSKSNFDDKMRQLNVRMLIKQLFSRTKLILAGCPLLTESSVFSGASQQATDLCKAILGHQYFIKTYSLNQC